VDAIVSDQPAKRHPRKSTLLSVGLSPLVVKLAPTILALTLAGTSYADVVRALLPFVGSVSVVVVE
jgi:hypothetical protein